jgi:hypothetical protein
MSELTKVPFAAVKIVAFFIKTSVDVCANTTLELVKNNMLNRNKAVSFLITFLPFYFYLFTLILWVFAA